MKRMIKLIAVTLAAVISLCSCGQIGESASKIVSAVVSSAGNEISSAISEGIEDFSDGISELKEGVSEVSSGLENAGSIVSEHIDNIAGNIGSQVSDEINSVTSDIQSMGSELSDQFDGIAGNIGSGERTEKFTLNPLLKRSEQPYLPSAYKAGNAGSYDRGHQIASADRWDYRVNLETFFGTNMTPQHNDLNASDWALLEGKVRDWAKKSDTLYVVTGCSVAGSDKYVLDADGKKVTVPVGYYKALLRLSGGKYSAAAFWFDNAPSKKGSIQKSMSMSVDDLEKKVGVDFFVNLDAGTQKSVEAQNPADEAWWWNN